MLVLLPDWRWAVECSGADCGFHLLYRACPRLSWSGHLGVTYNLVLKDFVWPVLKTDDASHWCSCHVCQITGKPNQVVHPAPLCAIPAAGEPFVRVRVDCVDPFHFGLVLSLFSLFVFSFFVHSFVSLPLGALLLICFPSQFLRVWTKLFLFTYFGFFSKKGSRISVVNRFFNLFKYCIRKRSHSQLLHSLRIFELRG